MRRAMKIYLIAALALCGCTEQPKQAGTQALQNEVYDDAAASIAPKKQAVAPTYDAKDFTDRPRPIAGDAKTGGETLDEFNQSMKDADTKRRIEALEATHDQP